VSSLWTPGGEHKVPRDGSPDPGPVSESPGADPGASGGAPRPGPEEDAAALDEVRQQLLQAPAWVVVANHAYGLFELAALHLSSRQPDLDSARLAIDAMAAVVEGLAGRLGEAETDLRQGLANLQMAFVQVKAAHEGTSN